MDNYSVQFVFDYCVITASCDADHEESAKDLAWDWVMDSIGVERNLIDSCNEIHVVAIGKDGE